MRGLGASLILLYCILAAGAFGVTGSLAAGDRHGCFNAVCCAEAQHQTVGLTRAFLSKPQALNTPIVEAAGSRQPAGFSTYPSRSTFSCTGTAWGTLVKAMQPGCSSAWMGCLQA